MKSDPTDPPDARRRAHPGKVLLKEFMKPLGLSADALALALGVPETQIGAIVRREKLHDAITEDIAYRLARHFRTTPAFWLSLQSAYYEAEIAAYQAREAVRPRVTRYHARLLLHTAERERKRNAEETAALRAEMAEHKAAVERERKRAAEAMRDAAELRTKLQKKLAPAAKAKKNARNGAIAERLKGGRGAHWPQFCDAIRADCGVTANVRGYSDRNIRRIASKIGAEP